jgi:hypothetical protein
MENWKHLARLIIHASSSAIKKLEECKD